MPLRMKIKLVTVDRGYERIKRELEKMHGSYTKVGLPSEAKPKSGRGQKKYDDMSEVATVLAVHEWGAPNKGIPERSTMRTSFDENVLNLQKIRNSEYNKILSGKSNVKKSLGVMGSFLSNKTKQKIVDLKFPPNKPSTVNRKGSSNPLVDTAQMLNSITHVEVLK